MLVKLEEVKTSFSISTCSFVCYIITEKKNLGTCFYVLLRLVYETGADFMDLIYRRQMFR